MILILTMAYWDQTLIDGSVISEPITRQHLPRGLLSFLLSACGYISVRGSPALPNRFHTIQDESVCEHNLDCEFKMCNYNMTFIHGEVIKSDRNTQSQGLMIQIYTFLIQTGIISHTAIHNTRPLCLKSTLSN